VDVVHDRRSSDSPDGRRGADQHPLNLLLTQVSHSVNEVSTEVKALNVRLSNHMHDETLELAEAVTSLMVKAFAGGDPGVHKAWHEAQIQEALAKADAEKAKKEFWSKLLFELAKFGLLGFVGWVVLTLWKGFLIGPKP